MTDLDFSLETLQQRVDKALQLNCPIDPEATLRYQGKEVKIKDLPTPGARAQMGYGHFSPSQSEVLKRPDGVAWPWKPTTCLVADGHRGVWIDPDHLACPGCGIDYT